jgi:hypothetical protein
LHLAHKTAQQCVLVRGPRSHHGRGFSRVAVKGRRGWLPQGWLPQGHGKPAQCTGHHVHQDRTQGKGIRRGRGGGVKDVVEGPPRAAPAVHCRKFDQWHDARGQVVAVQPMHHRSDHVHGLLQTNGVRRVWPQRGGMHQIVRCQSFDVPERNESKVLKNKSGKVEKNNATVPVTKEATKKSVSESTTMCHLPQHATHLCNSCCNSSSLGGGATVVNGTWYTCLFSCAYPKRCICDVNKIKINTKKKTNSKHQSVSLVEQEQLQATLDIPVHWQHTQDSNPPTVLAGHETELMSRVTNHTR